MAHNCTLRSRTMHENDHAWNRRSSILPSWASRKASEIQIVLDGDPTFIRSFTTFDEITGCVNFRFEKDTSIDDFAISFQGQTSTWIEKLATTSPTMGRTTGKHTFLRVQQPIDQRCMPECGRALAGVMYTVPFKFVVPDRLLDFTCSHKVEQDCIKDAHLLLPPSIGEPMLSGQGNTLMDDLAPNMSKIIYTIQARLLKASASTNKPDLIEEDLRVRIIPAREEVPPLSIDLMSKAAAGKYALRKENVVRRGIFKIGRKQGRLAAETLQPASLKLPQPCWHTEEPVTTMTTIKFRFDPASADETPPTLNSITNKLKAYTFFGTAPWKHFPAPDGYDIYSTLHSQYPSSINLSSRNLTNVDWEKHEPERSSIASSTADNVSISHGYDRRQSRSTCFSVPSNCSASTQNSRSTVDNLLSRRASALSTTSSSSTVPPSDSASSSLDFATSPSLHLSSKASIPAPSSSYTASLPYYTTSIVVPITLPTASSPPVTTSSSQSRRSLSISGDVVQSQAASTVTKAGKSKRSKPITFLPSFHSCLISRIYTLELSINVQSTSTINLRVPLQISLPHYNSDPTSLSRLRSSTPPPTPWIDHVHSSANSDDTNTRDVTLAATAVSQDNDEDQQDIQNDEDLVHALARERFLHSYRRHTLGDVHDYEDAHRPTSREGGSEVIRSNAEVGNHYVVPTAGTPEEDSEAPPEYYRTIRRASTTDARRTSTTTTTTTTPRPRPFVPNLDRRHDHTQKWP